MFTSESTATLLLSWKKDNFSPTHTSPITTLLVILKGKIDFHIENKTITLADHQTNRFEKDI